MIIAAWYNQTMNREAAPKTLFEKGLELNNKLDKAMIVGGAVVGLTFNPLLGGAIIGGSIVSMEAGKRIGREFSKNRDPKTAQQLGQVAARNR